MRSQTQESVAAKAASETSKKIQDMIKLKKINEAQPDDVERSFKFEEAGLL